MSTFSTFDKKKKISKKSCYFSVDDELRENSSAYAFISSNCLNDGIDFDENDSLNRNLSLESISDNQTDSILDNQHPLVLKWISKTRQIFSNMEENKDLDFYEGKCEFSSNSDDIALRANHLKVSGMDKKVLPLALRCPKIFLSRLGITDSCENLLSTLRRLQKMVYSQVSYEIQRQCSTFLPAEEFNATFTPATTIHGESLLSPNPFLPMLSSIKYDQQHAIDPSLNFKSPSSILHRQESVLSSLQNATAISSKYENNSTLSPIFKNLNTSLFVSDNSVSNSPSRQIMQGHSAQPPSATWMISSNFPSIITTLLSQQLVLMNHPKFPNSLNDDTNNFKKSKRNNSIISMHHSPSKENGLYLNQRPSTCPCPSQSSQNGLHISFIQDCIPSSSQPSNLAKRSLKQAAIRSPPRRLFNLKSLSNSLDDTSNLSSPNIHLQRADRVDRIQFPEARIMLFGADDVHSEEVKKHVGSSIVGNQSQESKSLLLQPSKEQSDVTFGCFDNINETFNKVDELKSHIKINGMVEGAKISILESISNAYMNQNTILDSESNLKLKSTSQSKKLNSKNEIFDNGILKGDIYGAFLRDSQAKKETSILSPNEMLAMPVAGILRVHAIRTARFLMQLAEIIPVHPSGSNVSNKNTDFISADDDFNEIDWRDDSDSSGDECLEDQLLSSATHAQIPLSIFSFKFERDTEDNENMDGSRFNLNDDVHSEDDIQNSNIHKEKLKITDRKYDHAFTLAKTRDFERKISINFITRRIIRHSRKAALIESHWRAQVDNEKRNNLKEALKLKMKRIASNKAMQVTKTKSKDATLNLNTSIKKNKEFVHSSSLNQNSSTKPELSLNYIQRQSSSIGKINSTLNSPKIALSNHSLDNSSTPAVSPLPTSSLKTDIDDLMKSINSKSIGQRQKDHHRNSVTMSLSNDCKAVGDNHTKKVVATSIKMIRPINYMKNSLPLDPVKAQLKALEEFSEDHFVKRILDKEKSFFNFILSTASIVRESTREKENGFSDGALGFNSRKMHSLLRHNEQLQQLQKQDEESEDILEDFPTMNSYTPLAKSENRNHSSSSTADLSPDEVTQDGLETIASRILLECLTLLLSASAVQTPWKVIRFSPLLPKKDAEEEKRLSQQEKELDRAVYKNGKLIVRKKKAPKLGPNAKRRLCTLPFLYFVNTETGQVSDSHPNLPVALQLVKVEKMLRNEQRRISKVFFEGGESAYSVAGSSGFVGEDGDEEGFGTTSSLSLKKSLQQSFNLQNSVQTPDRESASPFEFAHSKNVTSPQSIISSFNDDFSPLKQLISLNSDHQPFGTENVNVSVEVAAKKNLDDNVHTLTALRINSPSNRNDIHDDLIPPLFGDAGVEGGGRALNGHHNDNIVNTMNIEIRNEQNEQNVIPVFSSFSNNISSHIQIDDSILSGDVSKAPLLNSSFKVDDPTLLNNDQFLMEWLAHVDASDGVDDEGRETDTATATDELEDGFQTPPDMETNQKKQNEFNVLDAKSTQDTPCLKKCVRLDSTLDNVPSPSQTSTRKLSGKKKPLKLKNLQQKLRSMFLSQVEAAAVHAETLEKKKRSQLLFAALLASEDAQQVFFDNAADQISNWKGPLKPSDSRAGSRSAIPTVLNPPQCEIWVNPDLKIGCRSNPIPEICRIRDVSVNAVNIFINRRVFGFAAVNSDLTQRQSLEEGQIVAYSKELHKNQQRLRNVRKSIVQRRVSIMSGNRQSLDQMLPIKPYNEEQNVGASLNFEFDTLSSLEDDHSDNSEINRAAMSKNTVNILSSKSPAITPLSSNVANGMVKKIFGYGGSTVFGASSLTDTNGVNMHDFQFDQEDVCNQMLQVNDCCEDKNTVHSLISDFENDFDSDDGGYNLILDRLDMNNEIESNELEKNERRTFEQNQKKSLDNVNEAGNDIKNSDLRENIDPAFECHSFVGNNLESVNFPQDASLTVVPFNPETVLCTLPLAPSGSRSRGIKVVKKNLMTLWSGPVTTSSTYRQSVKEEILRKEDALEKESRTFAYRANVLKMNMDKHLSKLDQISKDVRTANEDAKAEIFEERKKALRKIKKLQQLRLEERRKKEEESRHSSSNFAWKYMKYSQELIPDPNAALPKTLVKSFSNMELLSRQDSLARREHNSKEFAPALSPTTFLNSKERFDSNGGLKSSVSSLSFNECRCCAFDRHAAFKKAVIGSSCLCTCHDGMSKGNNISFNSQQIDSYLPSSISNQKNTCVAKDIRDVSDNSKHQINQNSTTSPLFIELPRHSSQSAMFSKNKPSHNLNSPNNLISFSAEKPQSIISNENKKIHKSSSVDVSMDWAFRDRMFAKTELLSKKQKEVSEHWKQVRLKREITTENSVRLLNSPQRILMLSNIKYNQQLKKEADTANRKLLISNNKRKSVHSDRAERFKIAMEKQENINRDMAINALKLLDEEELAHYGLLG